MVAPDIVSLTGGVLPNDPEFWLAAATQAVRSYCGWHIAPAIDEELVIDGNGGETLFLPSLKINTLTMVTNDSVDVTSNITHSDRGMLEFSDGCGRFSDKFRGVTVSLNHGYALEDIADVSGIIVKLAKRAASASANVVSQGAGSQRVQYGTANGLPAGAELMMTEKAILDKYRVVEY